MEIFETPYDEDAVESSNEMNAVDQKFHDILDYVDAARQWAEAAEAVTDVYIATYDRPGIVKPNPESLRINEFGLLSAIGAVADESTLVLYNGFRAKTTTFNSDGSITEKDVDGYVLNTVFNSDGSITSTYTDPQGVIIRIKTTVFNSDGSISESVVTPESTT